MIGCLCSPVNYNAVIQRVSLKPGLRFLYCTVFFFFFFFAFFFLFFFFQGNRTNIIYIPCSVSQLRTVKLSTFCIHITEKRERETERERQTDRQSDQASLCSVDECTIMAYANCECVDKSLRSRLSVPRYNLQNCEISRFDPLTFLFFIPFAHQMPYRGLSARLA